MLKHDHDVNILNIIFQEVYTEFSMFMIIVTVINGIKVSMFFLYIKINVSL